jgi:hypothetical protein
MRISFDQWIVGSGVLSFVAVVVITLARQRRIAATDVGAFLTAYMSGCNIPPAIFLCGYGFWPDPPTVATKLHGTEKYVSMAGLALLCLAVIGLGLLLKKAYDRPSASPPS